MATETETGPTTTELGSRLRRARDKNASLSTVAARAEISPAYLQKLEAGSVKHPSPNVLYKLAAALDLDYAELMRLAGYVVPGDADAGHDERRNELRYALSSEALTDKEAEELAKYLEWYRERGNR